METRQLIRVVLSRTVAVFMGLWLGYFLCHMEGNVIPEQLVLLSLSVIVGYAGVILGMEMLHNRLIAIASAVASMLASIAAVVVSPPAHPFPIVAVALLLAAAYLQSRQPTMLLHLLSSFILALAAVSAGLFTGSLDGPTFGYAVIFAAYFAMADVSAKEVMKAEFQAIFFLLLVDLVIAAGLGVSRPFRVPALAFFVWMMIRSGWYGWQAMKDYTPRRRMSFSQSTLAGAGLLVTALLILQVKANTSVNLAWPTVSAAIAIIMIRLAPALERSEELRAGEIR